MVSYFERTCFKWHRLQPDGTHRLDTYSTNGIGTLNVLGGGRSGANSALSWLIVSVDVSAGCGNIRNGKSTHQQVSTNRNVRSLIGQSIVNLFCLQAQQELLCVQNADPGGTAVTIALLKYLDGLARLWQHRFTIFLNSLPRR